MDSRQESGTRDEVVRRPALDEQFEVLAAHGWSGVFVFVVAVATLHPGDGVGHRELSEHGVELEDRRAQLAEPIEDRGARADVRGLARAPARTGAGRHGPDRVLELQRVVERRDMDHCGADGVQVAVDALLGVGGDPVLEKVCAEGGDEVEVCGSHDERVFYEYGGVYTICSPAESAPRFKLGMLGIELFWGENTDKTKTIKTNNGTFIWNIRVQRGKIYQRGLSVEAQKSESSTSAACHARISVLTPRNPPPAFVIYRTCCE